MKIKKFESFIDENKYVELAEEHGSLAQFVEKLENKFSDDEEKTGASLEELMTKTGVSCTSCSQYTFKAKDGYQQTVDYEILKTGILTKNKRVFFPNTAHTLWVRDIIEIEVK